MCLPLYTKVQNKTQYRQVFPFTRSQKRQHSIGDDKKVSIIHCYNKFFGGPNLSPITDWQRGWNNNILCWKNQLALG